MNITLGVYDLFAYAVPGSLYLALATYIADRLAWINPSQIFHANTTLVIIAGAILSYIIGHITYMLGEILSRAYGRDKTYADAVHTLVERVPSAQGRPFLHAHRSIVQAAVEFHDVGAAVEILRLRAIGLMLRNCAPVFVLSTMTAIADAVTGDHLVVAVCCIALFPLATIGCLRQSAIMRHWANMKTLELAYWVPDIDQTLDSGISPTKRAQQPRQQPSSPDKRSTTSPPHRPQRSASQSLPPSQSQ